MKGGPPVSDKYDRRLGTPYFGWVDGKTIAEIRGLHTTAGNVSELVVYFTDETTLWLGVETEPHIVAVGDA